MSPAAIAGQPGCDCACLAEAIVGQRHGEFFATAAHRVEPSATKSDERLNGSTCAGGTRPTTIVWVIEQFREQHRAALDWLNATQIQRCGGQCPCRDHSGGVVKS